MFSLCICSLRFVACLALDWLWGMCLLVWVGLFELFLFVVGVVL